MLLQLILKAMVELTGQAVITHEQLNAFVRSKVTLHTSLGRAGFRLPSHNAAVCDLAFLMKVRERSIWCPMAGDLVISKVCFSPPPKADLL